MVRIPEPLLPREEEPRLRFRFSGYKKASGKYSKKKSWTKQSTKTREMFIKKIREYSRLTVAQFRSAGGITYRTREYRKLPAPPNLSPDVSDQRWHYFRVSKTIRVIGLLIGNVFHAYYIDFDHDLD